MKALLIFGARPNYMKIAPLFRAMSRRPEFSPILVNTGQHFDAAMSEAFIQTLGLPEPDIHLHVGEGSQAQQIARVIQKLEAALTALVPDVTIVVGDVNSTLGAALASSAVGIPIAHVEAGLRSRDWSMPEERNRVLTDRMSQYLFTHSSEADDNLKAEGIDPKRIHMVGNVMIDTLDFIMPQIQGGQAQAKYNLPSGPYGLVTLHRPANVDSAETLSEIVAGLEEAARRLPLCFPLHPRTQKRLAEFRISIDRPGITVLPPLPYSDFVGVLADASVVLTDSGGVQEETTVLGVPCLTLRKSTERPVTMKYGSNELVEAERKAIAGAVDRVLSVGKPEAARPPLWDGHASERIVEVLARELAPQRPAAASVEAVRVTRRSFEAILLAGGLRPSPLARDLKTPVLCLPLNENRSLLSYWLEAIRSAGDCRALHIIVSDADDAGVIRQHLADLKKSRMSGLLGVCDPFEPHGVNVRVEPARWRGTGGIIRDVADHMAEGEIVLLGEAGCLPPRRLDPLLDCLDQTVMATVGTGERAEPAGAYAVRREAFDLIPHIGFFDVKEQLLPALYQRGSGARAVKLADGVIRLRNREGYLQAVASRFDAHAHAAARLRATFEGEIASSARIAGRCLIGRGVVVEERAIVHDSVLLEGAVIRAGAVVSRSVVGHRAEIAPDRVVTDAIELSDIDTSKSRVIKGSGRRQMVANAKT